MCSNGSICCAPLIARRLPSPPHMRSLFQPLSILSSHSLATHQVVRIVTITHTTPSHISFLPNQGGSRPSRSLSMTSPLLGCDGASSCDRLHTRTIIHANGGNKSLLLPTPIHSREANPLEVNFEVYRTQVDRFGSSAGRVGTSRPAAAGTTPWARSTAKEHEQKREERMQRNKVGWTERNNETPRRSRGGNGRWSTSPSCSS